MQRPSKSRNIHSVGERFRVYYVERNPHMGRGSAKDGIPNATVLQDFANGLESGYKKLTGPKFGWPHLSGLPIDVYIASLGNVCGLASPAIVDEHFDEVAYLAFNCRGNEPSLHDARQRRKATAIHELTHLFQFELNAPGPWEWFDEAVATAMESQVLTGNRDHFRYLWDWITQPERSLDAGPGYSAAPFASYLMQLEWGPRIISEVYKLGQRSGGTLQAIDALAEAVHNNGTTLASATKPNIFSSRYCCDAYFLADPNGKLGEKVHQRFGDRFVSETFSDFPVTNAALRDPIDHLGCRYYRFRPKQGKAKLTVTVNLLNHHAQEHLRGELIGVTRELLLPGRRETLNRDEQGTWMTATLPNFHERTVDHAVLVLVNTAYGRGSANADGVEFTICADVR